jgi:predicted RNase H-like HicB family nuclease
MLKKLTIIVEQDEYGFYSFCPELKGCQSQGDTFEEAYENIKEAIELYLETLSPIEEEVIYSKQIFSTTYEVAFA